MMNHSDVPQSHNRAKQISRIIFCSQISPPEAPNSASNAPGKAEMKWPAPSGTGHARMTAAKPPEDGRSRLRLI